MGKILEALLTDQLRVNSGTERRSSAQRKWARKMTIELNKEKEN